MKITAILAAASLALISSAAFAADSNAPVMFPVGNTTLPAGTYTLTESEKGTKYILTIDAAGKMTAQDARAVEAEKKLAATTTAPAAATSPATTAPAATVAPTTTVKPATTTVPATTAAAPAAAPAGAPAAAPSAVQSTTNKLESLVGNELKKQLIKQAPRIQSEVNKVMKKIN